MSERDKWAESLGMYWDSLANFIRSIDGRHNMGAGLLAERIAEDFLPALLAEAERRGAEKGHDRGYERGWDDFEVGRSYDPRGANPYRAGDDQ